MVQPGHAHASSTGQAMTGVGWLDVHFESARPEYEAQLRAVGIEPGWRVLDAACGAGSFLPWLAEIVGPRGRLDALDLAPDNVAAVEGRLKGWGLGCPVEATVGTVLALPYPDGHFDAVWFANSSQYLSDEELATALAEFRRVVRPGGLVAVKESDLIRVLPAPPGLVLHHLEATAKGGNGQRQGVLRNATLPDWLRRAGLVAVQRWTTLIQRAAPLPPATRQLCRHFLAMYASEAVALDLPAADRACWSTLRDPAALERLLDDPDFYFAEGNILVVGRVPDAGA
jgi:arsenite methyltransferase